MATSFKESELETFVIAITVLKRKISDSFLASREGLSWGHMAVLARIAQEEGVTIASLAREEHMKPQSMRTLVEYLLDEDLIVQIPHQSDQRKHLFHLTKKGSTVRAQALREKIAWMQSALAELDEEEKALLKKSITILSKLAREGH